MRNKEGDINLEITHTEWENIINLIKIRNRITHPNLDSDLNISDEELKVIFNAANNIEKAMVRALLETVLRSSRLLAKMGRTNNDRIEKIISEQYGRYFKNKKI